MNRTHHNIDHISKCQLKKLFGIPPMCWPRNPTTSSVTPVKRRKKKSLPTGQLPRLPSDRHKQQETDEGIPLEGAVKKEGIDQRQEEDGVMVLGLTPTHVWSAGGCYFFFFHSLSSGRMSANIFCRLCCARIKLFLIYLWFVNTNIR